MENESKKKRNRKKKNKQAKSTEDTTSIGGMAHLEQNRLAASEQSVHVQSSNGGELDNSGHSESDAKPDQHELDTKVQEHTLAILEGQLARFESEKNSWLEKKAMLEDELAHLESEKRCWLEKEACLEEHIRILEDEKKTWFLEESSNKEMVARLNEANTVLQTEVKELDGSNEQLLQERQELVSRINNLELRIQELNKLTFHAESQKFPQDGEHSVHRGGTNALVEKLMTQNVELMGKVNELHIQIDQLKSASIAVKVAEFPSRPVISTQLAGETSQSSPQIEVPTVTSLDTRVPKTPPTLKGSAPMHSDTSLVQTVSFRPTSPIPMYPPQSSEKADSPLPMNNHLPNCVVLGSENNVTPSEDIGSAVQFDEIPVTYDNIEIVEEAEPESKASEDEQQSTELAVEERVVPLSDAPLVGAPFRFLGFVARYVSGADLVKPKKTTG